MCAVFEEWSLASFLALYLSCMCYDLASYVLIFFLHLHVLKFILCLRLWLIHMYQQGHIMSKGSKFKALAYRVNVHALGYHSTLVFYTLVANYPRAISNIRIALYIQLWNQCNKLIIHPCTQPLYHFHCKDRSTISVFHLLFLLSGAYLENPHVRYHKS